MRRVAPPWIEAFAVAFVLAATSAFPAAEPRVETLDEELILLGKQPEVTGPGRIRFEPRRDTIDRLLSARGARLAGFPLPDGSWVDLEVVASGTVHSGTTFVVSTHDGIQATTAPSARLFRGKVAGESESLVSLNLIDGHLAGFVRTGGREYSFGPRSFARDEFFSSRVEVVDDASGQGPGVCDGEMHPSFDLGRSTHDDRLITNAIDPGTTLIAFVAVEGTVEWVARNGGVSAASAATLNLMAQVSAIFENDVNVELQIPYMLMNATEPDGYTGDSNDTEAHITELRAKWNADPALRGVFRSVVHLFGAHISTGAGRAYLDVLCNGVPANTDSRDFGVTLVGAGPGRQLLAHELGHNFSSEHSHCYVPEIDRCHNAEAGCWSGAVVQTMGDIMSLCNAVSSVFHQRVIDERLRPAATVASPSCVFAALPGRLGGTTENSLFVDEALNCPSQNLLNDDGGSNGAFGYSGTILASWVKRFTPTCYPFALTGVQVQFGNSSVTAGRPVQVLVYTDASGSGSPASSVLAHIQDVAVQATGTQWNSYTLSAPVILGSGDFYVGFHDLLPDAAMTNIMDYDASRTGDSWRKALGTDPNNYGLFATGTWMIRAEGGAVAPGSVALSWGSPCNDAIVPNQDFAIYQGTLGHWNDLVSLTCTTGGSRSWLVDKPGSNHFWLVVPQTSANEGSYGVSSFGERSPAAFPCKPQSIGTCAQ